MSTESNAAEIALPSPQQLVLGRVNSLVAYWQEVRSNASLAPPESLEVLATWSHLRRFRPDSLDQDIVRRLDELIDYNREELVAQFMQCTFPVDWESHAEAIDEEWDTARTQDAADRLTGAIRSHFELLDRYQLALCTLNSGISLAGVSAPLSGFIARLTDRLRDAEYYLSDHIDVFFPAAPFATILLKTYREDLDSFDEYLWRTTLKYHRLEQLLEERDRDECATERFTPEQLRAMLKLFGE